MNEHYIKNIDENELYKQLVQYSELYKEKISSDKEDKIKASLPFLKNKAKTLEDIYNNSKFVIFDEVIFNAEDLNLINNKAKKILTEFSNLIKELKELSKETLEPIIDNLIKAHETNFKGVGQPLRVALTGSKFGPGIYDIITSLGKKEVLKRLGNKILC